jgi:hypothetical protein
LAAAIVQKGNRTRETTHKKGRTMEPLTIDPGRETPFLAELSTEEMRILVALMTTWLNQIEDGKERYYVEAGTADVALQMHDEISRVRSHIRYLLSLRGIL